jgi:hypothetical protein
MFCFLLFVDGSENRMLVTLIDGWIDRSTNLVDPQTIIMAISRGNSFLFRLKISNRVFLRKKNNNPSRVHNFLRANMTSAHKTTKLNYFNHQSVFLYLLVISSRTLRHESTFSIELIAICSIVSDFLYLVLKPQRSTYAVNATKVVK